MNAVKSLQHMLNYLSRTVGTIPRLAETGVFDESTLEAVMIFQRDFGFPVTGVVDQETWDSITAHYYQSLFQFGTPPLLSVLPSGTGFVGAFEHSAELLIVQAMLTSLQTVITNFEPVQFDGINSDSTLENLKLIQSLAGLIKNGALDRATWAILAALYRIFVTRQAVRTLSN